jgi:tetratricopeptide (TPR) repeat protein
LVNDVLRDLDNRREPLENAFSSTGLMNGKKVVTTLPYQKMLFLFIAFLILVLSFQLASNKSIIQILSSDENKYIVSQPNSLMQEVMNPEPAISITATTKEELAVIEPIATVEGIRINTEKVPENIRTIPPVISVIDKNIDIPRKSNVAIKKVEVAGNSEYQAAIIEYKQQRYTSALSSLDKAINESDDEKYQVFKARILLKQKDGIGFLSFIQQQADNTSLNWFQLVAPGLQLLSYYELSNQYYLQLIKQQPENIQWPLAMAINYSKLNQKNKTYAIYQSLLKSSLLSMKQRVWINSQVQSVDSQFEQEAGDHNGS